MIPELPYLMKGRFYHSQKCGFFLKELVLLKNLNREVMFCEEEEKKNTNHNKSL